jgi:NAD(P)H-flavin reductase
MVLDNNKLMLIYGFNEEERVFLDNLITEFKLPSYIVVEDKMASMKLKDIIEGLIVDTYDKELADEKVILFNNFADYELDAAIRAIRSSKAIKPILAVVTPTSINWEFHYLLNHLIEEREEARRYMKQKAQG